MQSKSKLQYILLTGPPGVGKTTLIKKVCDVLKAKNVHLNGFYTEEVREGRDRIGFDVVTFNGQRAQLARVNSLNAGPQVGKYVVDVKSFEKCSMPVFNLQNEAVLVLDEIGKMELFSEEFKKQVQKFITSSRQVLLATVPIAKGKPIPLVEMIKNHPKAYLVTVDRNNRNNLTEEIVNYVVSALADD